MMLLNQVSRFHVAERALTAGAKVNPKVSVVAHEKKTYLMHLAEKEKDYAFKHDVGEFSPCLFSWRGVDVLSRSR